MTKDPKLSTVGYMTIVIGLIADVQYADIEDTWNFNRSHKRKYRSTLKSLSNAVDCWSHTENLELVVDLGDAIDGFRNENRDMGIHALTKVMCEWHRMKSLRNVPILHLLGNHELYKFTRSELISGVEGTSFSCSAPIEISDSVDNTGSINYSFLIPGSTNWRGVVLDPYAESVMRDGGGRVGHELTVENGGLNEEFTTLCQKNNPNDILGSANFFAGIEGVAARWCPFNGGLGKRQLEWLEAVMQRAVDKRDKIIIFTHVIIHPSASPSGNCHTILWDYDKVLALIEKYDCVKFVFAGHAHQQGYFRCEKTRVHHVSLASPLEAREENAEETFATLEIRDSEKKAILIGRGSIPSMVMDIS